MGDQGSGVRFFSGLSDGLLEGACGFGAGCIGPDRISPGFEGLEAGSGSRVLEGIVFWDLAAGAQTEQVVAWSKG